MFLVKQIKPKRFKDKEFNRIFRNRLRRVGQTLIREDFSQTVKTWDHKVKFDLHTHLTARTPSPSIEIDTKDEVWNWLDQGTGLWGPKKKKYLIWAGIYTGKSNKKALAFPSVFVAKTKVGSLSSGSGMSGGDKVVRPYVEHPGIEPRGWNEMIVKKRKGWFKKQMQEGLHEANMAGGHRI